MHNSRPIQKYCNIKAWFPLPIPNKCVIRLQRCLWPHLLFLADMSLTPRCYSSLTYRHFNWFVSKLFIQQASLITAARPSSDIDFPPPCRLALTLICKPIPVMLVGTTAQRSGFVRWSELRPPASAGLSPLALCHPCHLSAWLTKEEAKNSVKKDWK